MRKTIVCLANSFKRGGSCFAGIDLESGAWARPLGTGEEDAVTATEQTFADGTRPRLLDIVEIPLHEAAPETGQPENWRQAAGRWTRTGHMNPDEVRALLEPLVLDTPVFGTNERSIPATEACREEVASSLAVVSPRNLRWHKEVWPERSRVRAVFEHAGAYHSLPVTDPDTCARLAQALAGDHRADPTRETFLVISLTKPHEEEHWKLVAGVVALPVNSGRTAR